MSYSAKFASGYTVLQVQSSDIFLFTVFLMGCFRCSYPETQREVPLVW